MPKIVNNFFNFVAQHPRSIGTLMTLIGLVALVAGTFFIVGHALPQSGIGAMGSLPAAIPVTAFGATVGLLGISLFCLKRKEQQKKLQLHLDTLPKDLQDIDLEKLPYLVKVLDFEALKFLLVNSQKTNEAFFNKMKNLEVSYDDNTVPFQFTIDSPQGSIQCYFQIFFHRIGWAVYLNVPVSMELEGTSLLEGWNILVFSNTEGTFKWQQPKNLSLEDKND